MDRQKIALLAVLAVLVAVCFSSGAIARRVKPGDAPAQARLSLIIKLAAALIALAIYLIVFAVL